MVDGLKSSASEQSADKNDPLLADLIRRKGALDAESSVASVGPQTFKLMSANNNESRPWRNIFEERYLINESYRETFDDTFKLPDFDKKTIRHFERAGNFLERVETLSDLSLIHI